MSHKEALLYLHARLKACGVGDAATVFPLDVSERLYQQSGGWPGSLNRQARTAIERAKELPVRLEDASPLGSVRKSRLSTPQRESTARPSLIVSKVGEQATEMQLSQSKVLIGRSGFADMVLGDQFVSKMHAAILVFRDALVLIDLNSANGTTVNSIPVSCTILREDDVIALGDHRLKVQNAPQPDSDSALPQSPDTIKMKTLMDMRRVRARRLAKAKQRRKDAGTRSA